MKRISQPRRRPFISPQRLFEHARDTLLTWLSQDTKAVIAANCHVTSDVESYSYAESDVQFIGEDYRAWTVEERLLSPRVIIFSKFGIFWQCEAGEWALHQEGKLKYKYNFHLGHRRINRRPDYYAMRKPILALGEAVPNSTQAHHSEIARLWLDIVEEYSGGGLTDPNDKFVALAGIVEEFVSMFGVDLGRYCAGIWSNFVRRGLLWRSTSPFSPQRLGRAPSWSWAVIDGSVEFLDPFMQELPYKVVFEVVNVLSTCGGNDCHDAYRWQASVTLEGCAVNVVSLAKMKPLSANTRIKIYGDEREIAIEGRASVWGDYPEAITESRDYQPDTLALIALMYRKIDGITTCGAFLLKAAEQTPEGTLDTSQRPVYRRFAFITGWELPDPIGRIDENDWKNGKITFLWPKNKPGSWAPRMQVTVI